MACQVQRGWQMLGTHPHLDAQSHHLGPLGGQEVWAGPLTPSKAPQLLDVVHLQRFNDQHLKRAG